MLFKSKVLSFSLELFYFLRIHTGKIHIYGFSSQLDALAERLAQLPKTVSANPIFKQIEKIEGLKTDSEGQLEELKRYGQKTTLLPILSLIHI